jgi:hypothetical protein
LYSYERVNLLTRAIEEAIKKQPKESCIVCSDERQLFPTKISFVREDTGEVQATIEAQEQEERVEPWLRTLVGVVPILICPDCARRKGITKLVEPEPSPVAAVPPAASPAPKSAVGTEEDIPF